MTTTTTNTPAQLAHLSGSVDRARAKLQAHGEYHESDRLLADFIALREMVMLDAAETTTPGQDAIDTTLDDLDIEREAAADALAAMPLGDESGSSFALAEVERLDAEIARTTAERNATQEA